MRAVQEPEFAGLVRAYIVDEAGAGGLPARTTRHELPAQHPFGKRFGDDEGRIVDPGLVGDPLPIRFGGARGDPVHHGGNERDVLIQPFQQRLVHCGGTLTKDPFQHVGVVGNVVAGDECKPSPAGRPPQHQARQHFSRGGLQRLCCAATKNLYVRGHLGIVEIEPSGRVSSIAGLGDRAGHDREFGTREVGPPGRLISGRVHRAEGGDELVLVAVRPLHTQRV